MHIKNKLRDKKIKYKAREIQMRFIKKKKTSNDIKQEKPSDHRNIKGSTKVKRKGLT